MHFVVANSTIYFFPIFLINYKRELDALGMLMLLAELSSYLLAAFLTLQGSRIIRKTRVFHPNMNSCLSVFLLQWFEGLVGKLLVVPYQKGWIDLPGNDASRSYSEFYSTSPSEMPTISSLWECPQFVIGAFLVTHNVTFFVMAIAGLTIERSFATYLINDYETRKRPSIHRWILVSLQLVALLIAFLAVTMILSVHGWLVLGFILVLGTSAGYAYIWYQNVRVHHILDTSLVLPSKYSLQARFQAKENVRSLNLTKCVVCFTMVCIFLETLFLCIQSSELLGKWEVPLFYLLDFSNTVHPIAVVPIILIAVPTWRRRFAEQYAFVPGVRRFVLHKTNETIVKVRTTSQQETEEYFDQFKKAWA